MPFSLKHILYSVLSNSSKHVQHL